MSSDPGDRDIKPDYGQDVVEEKIQSRGATGMLTLKRLMIALAALGLIYSDIAAAQLFGTKPVYIEGRSDCGDWLSSRQNRNAILLEHFVVGMLNGLAMGIDAEYWRADGRAISRDAAYFSIDQYCREHPTDVLITAVMTVFKQRIERGTAGR